MKKISSLSRTLFTAICYHMPIVFSKGMVFVILTTLISNSIWAQSSANYAFTTNTTGTLTTMTGSTQLVAASTDDGASALTNIGFDFWFMGTRYSQFSANSNGLVELGGTAVGTTGNIAIGSAATTPYISAFSFDTKTSSTGKVHYLLTGTAPNRILVIEWLNMDISYSSSTVDGQYQIQLSEATGLITFMYGAMKYATAPGFGVTTVSIGFQSSNTNNTYATINENTNAVTYTGAPTSYSMTIGTLQVNSASTSARRTYNLTPSASTAPTGMTFTSLAATSYTVNWSDNASNEIGYAVYKSTDGGVTYTYQATTAANATSYAATGLTSGTTYYWKVYAIKESWSTPVTGSQAPLATYTSIANTDWNTGSTWSPTGPPTAGSAVIVNTAVTLGSAVTNTGTITINSGASLTTTATITNSGTMTVNGTLQFNPGGYISGNNLVYGASPSTLVFNNSSLYGIGSSPAYWPSTNSPYNVTSSGSGFDLQSGAGARTVAGTLLLGAQCNIATAGNLTVTGTLQLNSGGYVSTNPPTYGSASTLVYNTTYGVGTEWTGNSTTAGAGVPQNVTIQNSATVTMPGGSGLSRGMAGNLSIASGNLTLGNNSTNDDLYVGGTWTRAAAATFTPNSRAVFFNGSGSQVVTVTGGGTETFNYLLVQGSGTLKLATSTNIAVTNSNGLSLSSSNGTSTIDLNGQTVTLSGGGNLDLGAGARLITSSATGGTFKTTTAVTTVTNGGSLSFSATNTTLELASGFDCGSGNLTTVNNILQIDLNGYVANNTPKYGSASTLIYNTTGTFGNGAEWTTGSTTTAGTGTPNNVTIQNSTTVSMTAANHAMAGSLNVITGGLTLNSGSGDVYVGGSWTRASGTTFTPNNRAVFFAGATAKTVTTAGGETFAYLLIQGGGNVTLASNASVTGVLTLTSGLLILGSNNLTLAAPSSGASTASYIVTSGGSVIQTTTSSAALIPIGASTTTTTYSPITITGASTYTCSVGTTIPGSPVSPTALVNLAWSVVASAPTTATITYQWNSANDGTTFNLAGTCDLGIYNGAYTTVTAGTPAGSNPYTVTVSGVSIPSTGTNQYVIGNTGSIKCSNPVYASLPYSQNFDGTWVNDGCAHTLDVPDAYWRNTIGTSGAGVANNNDIWHRSDYTGTDWSSTGSGTTTASATAQSGSYSARFHTYYAPNTTTGAFDLYLDCSTVTGTKTLSFYYINPETAAGDNMTVLLSTDGGATFPTTLLTLADNTAAWTSEVASIASNSATVVVRFLALSDYGSYDMNIDNLSVIGPPVITLTTNNIVAGSMSQNTTNNPIYSFNIGVTSSNATLTGLNVTTTGGTGSYVSADVTNLKAWYQATTPFVAASATLLSTLTTPGAAGSKTFPSFTNKTFNSGTNGYIFITADIPCAATGGDAIAINAVTSSNTTFVAGNVSGTPAAGNTQTILTNTPVCAGSQAASTASASTVLTWTAPGGCYSDVMVVISPASNTGGTPTGNGSAYAGNLTYGSGTAFGNGFVVYRGTTSSQTVTNLTNGTPYYVKFFTRNGTVWTACTEFTVTPTPTYCTPASSSSTYYINNFTTTSGLTNINNTTGYSTGGYGNYTAQNVSQYANSLINFSSSFTGGTFGFAIWVDWNNDGTFASGERMYVTPAYAASASGSFTVPLGTAAGNYRMRIFADFYGGGSPSDPCNFSTSGPYGEAEDYTFNVAVSSPPTITSSPGTVCSAGGQVVTIGGSNFLGASSVTFNGTAAASFTVVSSGSITATTPSGISAGTISVVTPGGTATSSAYTITTTPSAVVVSGGGTFCGTATLTATGGSPGTIYWQNTTSGGTSTTSGTTPQSVSSSNTYYYNALNGTCWGTQGSATVTINPIPAAPTPVTATPATICTSQTSQLNATASGSTINWWDAASGGTLLTNTASGANYPVTPSIATTYYAEALALVPTTQTFSYTGSIATFVVPTGVSSVTITAKGASGGYTSTSTAGKGASMTGTFAVTAGQTLSILAGQSPGLTTLYPAGGGGSFVGLGASYVSATPMIVAGGGGAAYSTSTGTDAPTTTSGTGTSPGTSGNGAPAGSCSGGGGGYYSSGGTDVNFGYTGGAGFQQGGAGGVPNATNGGASYQAGGFGGGAPADYYSTCNQQAGNGGGYSGGSAFGTTLNTVGNAGGSYNGGTSPTNIAGSNTGNGVVTITYLATGTCASTTRTGVTVNVNTVSTAPTGISSSASATICNNGSGTTLTATGGTLGTGATYQWGTGSTVGTSPVSGATSVTYSVTPTTSTTYWVSITGVAPCGSPAGGATQAITVSQPSVAPTGISGSTTVCSGAGTTLTATGGTLGTGATYQWGAGTTVGTNPISGATSVSYSVTPTGSTTYWVSITGAAPCGSPAGGATQLVNLIANQWLGGATGHLTEWNWPANWCSGLVPTATTDVYIPSATYQPTIGPSATAVAVCQNISIGTGASLTMANASTLTISAGASYSSFGNFVAGNGSMIFAGAGAINTTSAITFNNLTINGTLTNPSSPTTTVNGTLTINGGNLTNAPIYGASSTLYYNVTYGRYVEWNATGAGTIGTTPGYPYNVTVNTGTFDVYNSASGVARALAGTLTINSGATMNFNGMNAAFIAAGDIVVNGGTLNMNTMSGSVNAANLQVFTTGSTLNMNTMSGSMNFSGNVLNNGTLNLSTASGGDIYTAGNWTKGASATFNPNSRAVFMNGTGTQVVKVTGGGTETFNYLIIQGSGTMQLSSSPATNAIVNSVGGLSLSSSNATSTIDLNGQTLTLAYSASGNLNVNSGNRYITSTIAGGIMKVTTSIPVLSSLGTLTFASGTTLLLQAGFDGGGAGALHMNSTLQIDPNGYMTNNAHAPTYGPGSILKYNTGGAYTPQPSSEWYENTYSQPGVPYNVVVATTGTNLNFATEGNPHEMWGDLTINPGTTLALNSTTSGADFKIKGNWSNSGTFTCGGRLVLFEGSTAQTMTGATTFDYLQLSNSAGLTINNDATVNSVLYLTTGILTTGTNYVIVTSTASAAVSGHSASSYIIGNIRRYVTAYSGTTGNYDFPMGGSISGTNQYELANILFTSTALGTTTYLEGKFNTGSTTAPSPSTCFINASAMGSLLNGGYWTIHADNQPATGSTYTATMYLTGYTNAPSTNTTGNGPTPASIGSTTITPRQQIGLLKRTSSAAAWVGSGITNVHSTVDQGTGTHVISGTSIPYLSGGQAIVARSGVPSFSDFAIGIEQINKYALPVKLLFFSAEKKSEDGYLTWATASEINNDHFDIERSTDGVTFVKVGTVAGHGNSSQTINYDYTDHNIATLNVSVVYYRLKQVDIDDQFEYSDIASVELTAGADVFHITSIYPNPFTDHFSIAYYAPAAQAITIAVYNVTGELVSQEVTNANVGMNVHTLADQAKLAAGFYTVNINTGLQNYSYKIVKGQ